MNYFTKFAHSFKAREDEYVFLGHKGWIPISIGTKKYSNVIVKNIILWINKTCLLFKRFKDDDFLWVQIPDTHHFKSFFIEF